MAKQFNTFVNKNVRDVSLPTIVKYEQKSRTGVHMQRMGRHSLGYIQRGSLDIFYSDHRHRIETGMLFYLSPGCHYIDFVPDGDRSFNMIVFYYSPEDLGRILSFLSLSYNLEPDAEGDAKVDDPSLSHALYPAWDTLKSFFSGINSYLNKNEFFDSGVAGDLKMTELVYLILSHKSCTLRGRMLCKIDSLRESLERVVRDNIFSDVSIKDLASKTNRCLTAFKRDFKRHFGDTPHQWFIHQRLNHARLLLISTDKPVMEIGLECMFKSPVHFSKHFKHLYGLPPSSYRIQFSRSLGEAANS